MKLIKYVFWVLIWCAVPSLLAMFSYLDLQQANPVMWTNEGRGIAGGWYVTVAIAAMTFWGLSKEAQ